MRTELLPTFGMPDKKVDGFIARIRERHPKMIFGYPSAMSHIVPCAEQRGVRFDDLGIKVVFCTSERLYNHQRETIVRLFGCPVANGYGGRDAGFIAHECPNGNMHVITEDIVVEIINETGRVLPHGQSGKIVVTHLATRDYPFIRYRTGDIASLSEETCSCGRGLPLLTDIQGRNTDFVVAAEGTVLHGLALIYVVHDLNEVRTFKIVRKNREHTRILLAPEAGGDMTGIDTIIIDGFRCRLGAKVTVKFVDAVLAEKSGKFCYVASHVVLH